jgi:hypothetical protein
MSVSLKSPPTGRDFLAYQRVVVDGASTRTVAAELNISQTRVRQLILRVMQWLVETLPADAELSEAGRLRLAQHIAADRLERFYGEANRLWQQTTQPKFAYLCIRVSTALSKRPALPGTLEGLAMDAILGPLADDLLQARSASEGIAAGQRASDKSNASPRPIQNPKSKIQNSVPPPIRDCSPSSTTKAPAAQQPASAPAPTPSAPEPSVNLPPAVRAARSAFLSPAHPPTATDNELPVTQLKITPQTLGLSTNKSLSRKERRRLKRLANSK